MTQINIKTINALFNLITEEELSCKFKSDLLRHKLTLIKQLSEGDESIVKTIDYILDNILVDTNPSNLDEKISLFSYYSVPEVEAINKILRLPSSNHTLSEETLDEIYSNNKSSEQIKKLYQELKCKHFKPPKYYLDERYQNLTNVSDRAQYEQERMNALR